MGRQDWLRQEECLEGHGSQKIPESRESHGHGNSIMVVSHSRDANIFEAVHARSATVVT